MAARILFVKPEHVEILQTYLPDGIGGGVALVYPQAHNAAIASGLNDGEILLEYDFGGCGDFCVDKINFPDHFSLQGDGN